MSKFRKSFIKTDSMEICQIAVGIRIALGFLHVSKIFKLLFWSFVSFFLIVIASFIIFLKLEVVVWSIGIALILFSITFLINFVFIADAFYFNVNHGIKIIIKGLFQDVYFLLMAICFGVMIIVLIGGTNIFYSIVTGILLILGFWFSFSFPFIYDIDSYGCVLYSITLMKEIIDNDKSKSFLLFRQRAKMQKCLIIIYNIYVEEAKSLFNEKTVSLMNFISILKLSALVGLIDDNDKGNQKKILEILEKMEKTNVKTHPTQFIKIMNEIDDFSKQYNIGDVVPEKRVLVGKFGKYAILIVIVVNVVISIVKYFSGWL